jgi:hypothetical protein
VYVYAFFDRIFMLKCGMRVLVELGCDRTPLLSYYIQHYNLKHFLDAALDIAHVTKAGAVGTKNAVVSAAETTAGGVKAAGMLDFFIIIF